MTINLGVSIWPKVLGFVAMASGVIAAGYMDSTATVAGLLVWKFAGMVGAIATGGIGFVTRQDNKSSEQVGAGVIEAPPTTTALLAEIEAIKKRIPVVIIVLCGVLFLTGCETGTRDPRVVAALAGSQKRYETRITNADAREQADEDAIVDAHSKQIDIAANASVQIIASDPVTYPPAKALQEVHRVDQVAADKKAAQARTIQKMKDLRAKDDAVNLAGARALMAKVMQYDAAPAIDLTGTVQTILTPPLPEPGK